MRHDDKIVYAPCVVCGSRDRTWLGPYKRFVCSRRCFDKLVIQQHMQQVKKGAER